MSTSRSRKVLEETREIMRLRHYSIHAELGYGEVYMPHVLSHSFAAHLLEDAYPCNDTYR